MSKSNNRKEIEIPLALLTIPEDESAGHYATCTRRLVVTNGI